MIFSIIIPTYNEEEYLPVLLDSIKMQSFDDYEIIVVPYGLKGLLEHGFTVRDVQKLYFRTHKVDVGGNHMELWKLCLDKGVTCR